MIKIIRQKPLPIYNKFIQGESAIHGHDLVEKLIWKTKWFAIYKVILGNNTIDTVEILHPFIKGENGWPKRDKNGKVLTAKVKFESWKYVDYITFYKIYL